MIAALILSLCTLTAEKVSPDRLHLVNGDVLHVQVIEEADDHVVVDHPVLGRLTIPRASIAQIVRQEEGSPDSPGDGKHPDEVTRDPAPPGVEAPTEPENQAAPALPPPPTPVPWKVSLELGFTGTQGNTETTDIRLALLAGRETTEARIALDTSYLYGETSGDRRLNRFTAGGRHDWLFPESRWFIFAQARYDYDEFQSWEQRVTGGAGVGYEFVKNDTVRLMGRAGLGAVWEIGSEDDGIEPEAILGLDFGWQITSRQRLGATTTFYPNLGDLGEFRIVSSADWTIQLDQASGIDLKLGVAHEHQSRVDPGRERDDIKVFGSIVIRF